MLAHTYFKCHQRGAGKKAEKGGHSQAKVGLFLEENCIKSERDTDDVSGLKRETDLSLFFVAFPFPRYISWALSFPSSSQLSSLSELRSNPDYVFLKELYASGNNLKTLEDLRGSPFLVNNPTTLDVRDNKITDVKQSRYLYFVFLFS